MLIWRFSEVNFGYYTRKRAFFQQPQLFSQTQSFFTRSLCFATDFLSERKLRYGLCASAIASSRTFKRHALSILLYYTHMLRKLVLFADLITRIFENLYCLLNHGAHNMLVSVRVMMILSLVCEILTLLLEPDADTRRRLDDTESLD